MRPGDGMGDVYRIGMTSVGTWCSDTRVGHASSVHRSCGGPGQGVDSSPVVPHVPRRVGARRGVPRPVFARQARANVTASSANAAHRPPRGTDRARQGVEDHTRGRDTTGAERDTPPARFSSGRVSTAVRMSDAGWDPAGAGGSRGAVGRPRHVAPIKQMIRGGRSTSQPRTPTYHDRVCRVTVGARPGVRPCEGIRLPEGALGETAKYAPVDFGEPVPTSTGACTPRGTSPSSPAAPEPSKRAAAGVVLAGGGSRWAWAPRGTACSGTLTLPWNGQPPAQSDPPPWSPARAQVVICRQAIEGGLLAVQRAVPGRADDRYQDLLDAPAAHDQHRNIIPATAPPLDCGPGRSRPVGPTNPAPCRPCPRMVTFARVRRRHAVPARPRRHLPGRTPPDICRLPRQGRVRRRGHRAARPRPVAGRHQHRLVVPGRVTRKEARGRQPGLRGVQLGRRPAPLRDEPADAAASRLVLGDRPRDQRHV